MFENFKKFSLITLGILVGFAIPFGITKMMPTQSKVAKAAIPSPTPTTFAKIYKREVNGFLPFWLISKANKDYSKYVSNLTYFNLTVDKDGSILRTNENGEGDPGWYTLKNGKVDSILKKTKDSGGKLSIAVFSSSDDKINKMLEDPNQSALNLTYDVLPIMKEYGFSELNLDIEKVKDASSSARINFTEFVKNLSIYLKSNSDFSLSIDIAPIALVKDTNLVNPDEVSKYVDKVILMGYDYHYPGSYVSGPVAPLHGAGTVSEYDVETAILKALEIIPAEKIILGTPLYGYEWETTGNFPRSTVIPGSGQTISSDRAETEAADCSGDCKVFFDETDKETHMIYKDSKGEFYHQAFYPDIKSMEEKVKFAKNKDLGGIALWALGYEGESILKPLAEFYH